MPSIVKDHDGWMEVADRSGGNAVFRVFLPIAPEDAPVDRGKPGATPPPQTVA